MNEFRTEFAYKDARTYINSSTLCEFLASEVAPAIGLQDCEIRLDARFHKVVKMNGIMRCQETREPSAGASEFGVEFVLDAAPQVFYVYFAEGREPVLSRMATLYEIEDLELISPYAGSGRIMIRDIRSLLENTIEANKRLHQATCPDREVKVINLYMKRFPLAPVPRLDDWTVLKIQHLGTRNYGHGIATLNTFSLPESGLPEFRMCFFLPGVG